MNPFNDLLMMHLVLVDEAVDGEVAFVAGDTTGEPESNFTLGRLNRVRAVADVAA